MAQTSTFLQKAFIETKVSVFDAINAFLGKRNLALATYNFHNTRDIFQLVSEIKRRMGLAMTVPEGVQIYLCAKGASRIEGDIAEVGVFKGGSAAIIAEAVPAKKHIYLFDTFSGLPELQKIDEQFSQGQYEGTLDEVKNNLKKYKNMTFHKGMFPATGKEIKTKKFSFVHLDVDLYKSTKDSIEFFYPRLSPGGMILIHDYPQLGIIKAIQDGLRGKKAQQIVLAGPQCLIVKY